MLFCGVGIASAPFSPPREGPSTEVTIRQRSDQILTSTAHARLRFAESARPHREPRPQGRILGVERRGQASGVSIVLDADSERWLNELRSQGSIREQAIKRLHGMLHGIARAEGARRRGSLPADIASNFDDLCLQAADDATVAVVVKLDSFRGASRFTSWAYKFAILEVSARLRRLAWSRRRVVMDELSWGRLASPAQGVDRSLEEQELLTRVKQLVETTLSEHQRQVFLAVVAHEIPIDVIAERTGSSRGAVYKTVHDARRKMRNAMVESGLLEAG